MPSVDLAMARSLRPRAWDLIRDAVARGVVQDLSRRNIVQDTQSKINNVKTAFSSWDNCMKATFCKWPVIAVIIVGSLIILSIVWCIIRCCCCGVSCCCSCFSCLKCCGNCCGCCDPPGGRKTKYLDEAYAAPRHGQGYHAQAPMQSHFPQSTPAKFQPPQYAEFEVSKKGSGDTLPPMPTWEPAGSGIVMVEEEVEMSNLKKSPLLDQNRQRMNAPSPGPVSPMSPVSMNYGGQSYGGVSGSSRGQIFNHSQQGQQGLVLNQQAVSYGQSRQGPYGQRGNAYNHTYHANRHSDGFGLDEPYDEPSPMSSTGMRGHPGHQNLAYGAPAQQPYDSLANQPYGAAPSSAAVGVAGAMGLRNQTVSPQNSSPYGVPPMDAAAVGVVGVRNQSTSPSNNHPFGPLPTIGGAMGVGRQSPAPAPRNQNPYGQEQIHEQYAEMPAMPHDSNSVQTPTQGTRAQTPSAEHIAPMELAGSSPTDGYGMKRPDAAKVNASPVHSRSPYDMDPHDDQGYGRPPPQSPPDNVNKSYSPAPPRQFTPGPERRVSPVPERQRTPGPHPLSRPMPPSSNSYEHMSPPQSPITNNAGFDFTSGYSRPQGSQSPPCQSPTTAAYPGQRTYQPSR